MSKITVNDETVEHDPCPCSGCGRADTRNSAAYWHYTKGPLPLVAERRGIDREVLRIAAHPVQWLDHWYRIRQEDDSWKYVAEPYWLYPDAFEDFAYLEKHGWKVRVSASNARHFPGYTIAIEISRKALPE